MKVLLMVSMDKRARLDAVIEGLCTGGSNTFEVFGRDTGVHCFRSESEARIGLEMESPSPTSGGRGGGGGGRGGGRGPVASLGARFEDIAVFNQRAGLLEKKMEQLVGTMQNTHGEIDERLKEIASANKETSTSTATIATQLQAAETQISVMAGQSAATSEQLAATSAEVQNMAVAVNALLKFNADRAQYDSASRGLKHDGSDILEMEDFDSKWCAVMDAARVPGLLHLENDLRNAAMTLTDRRPPRLLHSSKTYYNFRYENHPPKRSCTSNGIQHM